MPHVEAAAFCGGLMGPPVVARKSKTPSLEGMADNSLLNPRRACCNCSPWLRQGVGRHTGRRRLASCYPRAKPGAANAGSPRLASSLPWRRSRKRRHPFDRAVQHRLRQSRRRKNAKRKSSAPSSAADALFKKANKNQLARMAPSADMADSQKAGGFHQSDALRSVFFLTSPFCAAS
jgi:hypothetical protein